MTAFSDEDTYGRNDSLVVALLHEAILFRRTQFEHGTATMLQLLSDGYSLEYKPCRSHLIFSLRHSRISDVSNVNQDIGATHHSPLQLKQGRDFRCFLMGVATPLALVLMTPFSIIEFDAAY